MFEEDLIFVAWSELVMLVRKFLIKAELEKSGFEEKVQQPSVVRIYEVTAETCFMAIAAVFGCFMSILSFFCLLG